MNRLGYQTSGDNGTAVKMLKQATKIDPLLHRQADCISAMTYNEYWQVLDAGLEPEQLVTFNYEDQGVATLEDGLYTLDRSLADAMTTDRPVHFEGFDQGLGLRCQEPSRSRDDRSPQRHLRVVDRGASNRIKFSGKDKKLSAPRG